MSAIITHHDRRFRWQNLRYEGGFNHFYLTDAGQRISEQWSWYEPDARSFGADLVWAGLIVVAVSALIFAGLDLFYAHLEAQL